MHDLQARVEMLESLARQADRKVVREALQDFHVVDLAEGFERLESEDAVALLRAMGAVQAADLLVELPSSTARPYLDELPDTTLAHYLDILPMDDAVELRDIVGEERFDALLNVIPKEDALELRRLLTYPEDSVGRFMTEAFFKVHPEATMQTVIDDIRRSPVEKYEMVNDLYVLSEDTHLLGVFSLRKAIRARPDTPASDLMNEDVRTVNATTSAEQAARDMAKYGYYALPVLDNRGRMVGLFTGDDAQDIIREADTEDVLALGAVSGGSDSYMSQGPVSLFGKRMPWLLALFVAETLTGIVMRHYGKTEGGLSLSPLTFFIPLIIGAGGNSGSQVTTTITRALAVGEIRPTDVFPVLKREFVVACMIGVCLGLAGFLRAKVWGSPADLTYVVGLALPAIVIWATSVGSVLPLGAKRLGIDPAVMSAPFISTFVDATGLIIYFEIARAIMRG
jgi:magnesium transporter